MYYIRQPGVRVQLVGGEALVLDHEGERVHQLNRTATFIWRQCDGRTTPDAIVSRVVEEFEVDPTDAARDVAAAIEQFCELKLLTT
jgi:hypothetical protein